MHRIAVAIAALIGVFIALPAWAQSEVVITQAKALAGNVTPGDTAGYPITLSQTGAYILGSNLTVPNNQYGIFAGADNIDIDLNGFTLTGNGGGTYGIVSNRAQGVIHGGAIKLFRSSGIYLRGNMWTIEDMKIVSNGSYGIDASGARYVNVQQSLIASNSGGVLVGDDARIEGSTVASNGSAGIQCVERCYVGLSSINTNQGNGIFVTGDGGIIIGNAISLNAARGIASYRNAFPTPANKTNSYGNNSIIGNIAGSIGGTLIPMQPNGCAPSAC